MSPRKPWAWASARTESFGCSGSASALHVAREWSARCYVSSGSARRSPPESEGRGRWSSPPQRAGCLGVTPAVLGSSEQAQDRRSRVVLVEVPLETLLVLVVLDGGRKLGQKLAPTLLQLGGAQTRGFLLQAMTERIPLLGRDTRRESELDDSGDAKTVFDALRELVRKPEVGGFKGELSTCLRRDVQRLTGIHQARSSDGIRISANEHGFVGEDFDLPPFLTEATDPPPPPSTLAVRDADDDEEPEDTEAGHADEDNTEQAAGHCKQQRGGKGPSLLERMTSNGLVRRGAIGMRRSLHPATRALATSIDTTGDLDRAVAAYRSMDSPP